MRRDPPKNLAASVRQRLLNLTREKKEAFNFTLRQYANERFLYRLSCSESRDRFVLKGATLFVVWLGKCHRPTRDLDLLGFGDPSTESIAESMKDICREDVEPDGLVFDPESVQVSEIREEQEYGGVRVHLTGLLESAKIDLRIDVAFGDVVTPSTMPVSFPVMLDFPSPRIGAYPRESMVAEKLEAIVSLGLANSRMKDFYDLSILAHRFPFEGQDVVAAIQATFQRRQTAIPEEPTGLTASFYANPEKVKQWSAFLTRSQLEAEPRSLQETVDRIRDFLLPPLESITSDLELEMKWSPGGPWK